MDTFYIWIVNRLPKKLVFYCFYRVCVYATSGKYDKTNSAIVFGGVRAITVLNRWRKDFLDK